MLLKVDRCVIALSQCDGAVQGDTSASPLRLIYVYNMESRISRACCLLNGPRPPAGSRRKNASGWIQESWWSRNELRPQKPRLPSASQRGCRDEVQPFSRTHLQVSSGNKLLKQIKSFLAVMRNLGSANRTSRVLGVASRSGDGLGNGGGVGVSLTSGSTQLVARQLPCTCDDARMRTYVIIVQEA